MLSIASGPSCCWHWRCFQSWLMQDHPGRCRGGYGGLEVQRSMPMLSKVRRHSPIADQERWPTEARTFSIDHRIISGKICGAFHCRAPGLPT